MIHRVGVVLGIATKPLEQAVDSIVSDVEIAAGHEAAVFCIEQEYQPHENSQQAVVDGVGMLGQNVAEQIAVGSAISALEATQQLVKGVEHLLGKLSGNSALVVSASFEQRGQAGLRRCGQKAVAPQEHLEGRQNGPAGDVGHSRDGEGQGSGVLAPRRVDEPQVRAVREEADGCVRLAQKPLEPAAGGRGPAGQGRLDCGVQVRAERQFLDEQYENVLVAGPMLPIEGSEEYYKALDKTVQAVMLGQMSAAKAMKRVARMWEDTTEDIGRKGQAEVWRGVVKDFYPPHLQLKD